MTELSERIAKLDAKSDGKIQTLTEQISKLIVRLDGNAQATSGAVSRLDSKLDTGVQLTNEAVSKLDSKLDGGLRAMSEAISNLDGKSDGNMQMTNQAIGDLYKEKLSVQEFREFINVFNKIFGESFLLPEKPATQFSEPAVRESNDEVNSCFQGKPVVVARQE